LLGAVPAVSQSHPGATVVRAGTPGEVRDWDALVSTMVDQGELRTRQVRDDTLIPGRIHERLAQFYKGVPVFGGELVRQWDGVRTVSLFGTLYGGIDRDPRPALSPDEARAIVERLSRARILNQRLPRLVILPLEGGGYALTYYARAMTEGDLVAYFIDAASGELVLSYSDLKTQAAVGAARGVLGDEKKISVRTLGSTFVADDQLRPPSLITYDLQGNLSKLFAFFNDFRALTSSDLARDADNNWTDGANVDAHVYAGWVYDYFFKRHGRRGLDNNDIEIINLVHPVRREDLFSYPPSIINTFYVNAFYCCDGIMVYGEGLPSNLTLGGQRWNYLAGGLDVVAHELTHGVTDFSSQLIYRNESGALNESFSDVMAAAVEFFFQEPGSGSQRADYLIGEDVVTPGGIRSLSNPVAYGDPDHYSIRFTGSADNGGVHINSGISNHAFYLAIEGGQHRVSGLVVQGVGAANRQQIERVFYRAFVFFLPPSANFSLARAATILAARELYGAGSRAEVAVTQAWAAVGVF
jgi:thermolysin